MNIFNKAQTKIQRLLAAGWSVEEIARAARATPQQVKQLMGEVSEAQTMDIVVGDFEEFGTTRSMGRDVIKVPYHLADDLVPALQAQGHRYYPSLGQVLGISDVISQEQVDRWKAGNA